jgi:hypothetical protein
MIFWCNSSHAKFRMYQTQTVIVKNLNAVAASRCPVRWIIVYKNKLIQVNTYRMIYSTMIRKYHRACSPLIITTYQKRAFLVTCLGVSILDTINNFQENPISYNGSLGSDLDLTLVNNQEKIAYITYNIVYFCLSGWQDSMWYPGRHVKRHLSHWHNDEASLENYSSTTLSNYHEEIFSHSPNHYQFTCFNTIEFFPQSFFFLSCFHQLKYQC